MSRYWTYPQLRKLLAMQPTHSYSEIAAALNRTPMAIMRKVPKLRAKGQAIPDARVRNGGRHA